MPLSKNDLNSRIQAEIRVYFEQIGMPDNFSIMYHQIDSLSFVEDNKCDITLRSSAGEVKGQFFKSEALVIKYYVQNFPDLRPMTCEFNGESSLEDLLLQAEDITLANHIQRNHNVMIIPVFSPLNRIGIFTLDLEGLSHKFEDALSTHIWIGKILAYAQNCHIKISQLQNKTASDRIRLTDRERQILLWVVRGKSNAVIAEIVGISLHTVNGYLRNIYLKTETCDRTSAAVKAVHHGLLNKPLMTDTDAYNAATPQTATAH